MFATRKVSLSMFGKRAPRNDGHVYKLAEALNKLKVGQAVELTESSACSAAFVTTVIRAVTDKQYRRVKDGAVILIARVA